MAAEQRRAEAGAAGDVAVLGASASEGSATFLFLNGTDRDDADGGGAQQASSAFLNDETNGTDVGFGAGLSQQPNGTHSGTGNGIGAGTGRGLGSTGGTGRTTTASTTGGAGTRKFQEQESIGDLLDRGADITRMPLPRASSLNGPYLDVMTVRGPLTSEMDEEPHSKLLVEPVLMPRMSHLAVDRPVTPDDVPLFYPSGDANANLRNTLHDVIRTNAVPKGTHSGLGKVSRAAHERILKRSANVSGPSSSRVVTAKRKRRMVREASRKCVASPKPASAARQSRLVHSLTADHRTKGLILELRDNSAKLTRLGMLS